MRRYTRAGPLYDILSLEAILYGRPRARLATLFGRQPGATVLDVGCGTGLNFGWLRDAVAPGGTVVGVDASASMLSTARRRIERHEWTDVELIHADLLDIAPAMASTADAFVATFVLSLLPDDASWWAAVDAAAVRKPVRVAIADVGDPTTAPSLLRPMLRALATLGGAKPGRCPWVRLATRSLVTRHEVMSGGHVHLAAATVPARQSRAANSVQHSAGRRVDPFRSTRPPFF